ncbi:hypothetical protein [Anaerobaca lacustris]|uniref:DUF5658 domain-containing protein n=1 Tax=Anaerobaca lacustris TaxID=3044600 RepID=A0AAW6U3C6_9BACT|nr:hypothetical protein [Sedimentisphaerales bacterium M17dextr]
MTRIQSIQDIPAQLRGNWPGYLAQYWIFLVLLALAAIADMLSTVFFMAIDGPEAESHPVIRLISVVLGPVLGPVIGKLSQVAAAVVLTVYLRRWAIYIFVAVIILYAWAAVYNVVATPLLLPVH